MHPLTSPWATIGGAWILTFTIFAWPVTVGQMVDAQDPGVPGAIHDDGGLPNLRAVAPGIHCGGQPTGDAAADQLRALGVRTIVSVDGVQPDPALAAKLGIRRVHVPMGYDGVDPAALAALAHLMGAVQGPVYIHCHHGKHRGPAAAAIAAMASGAIDHQAAIALLRSSGTDPRYTGLWDAVRTFNGNTTKQTVAPEYPESAPVDPMVTVMVDLDSALDRLRRAHASGDPREHANGSGTVGDALAVLRDGFGEAIRFSTDYNDDFSRRLRDSLTLTDLSAIESSCVDCHRVHRD